MPTYSYKTYSQPSGGFGRTGFEGREITDSGTFEAADANEAQKHAAGLLGERGAYVTIEEVTPPTDTPAPTSAEGQQ